MAEILVLQHNHDVGLGWLADALRFPGARSRVVRLDRGEQIPRRATCDGVVALGGHMGAYDENEFPFLADEKAYLRRAVESATPVLGICLGAQLLADALGGAAFAAPAVEAGVLPLDLTSAGRAHPLLGSLGEPVVMWHGDTFDLPPHAVLLAASDRYPHAFEAGSALAVQFHPEASSREVAGWMTPAGLAKLATAGVDPAGFLAAVRDQEARLRGVADRLLGGWVRATARSPLLRR